MSAQLYHLCGFLHAWNQWTLIYPWLDIVSAQRWCSPTTSTRVQKLCIADTSTTQQQTRTSQRESGVSCCFPLFPCYVGIDPAPRQLGFRLLHTFMFFWSFWKHYSRNSHLRLCQKLLAFNVSSSQISRQNKVFRVDVLMLQRRFQYLGTCRLPLWQLRCFCLREKWGDLWLKLILRQVLFSSPTGTSPEEAKVAFFCLKQTPALNQLDVVSVVIYHFLGYFDEQQLLQLSKWKRGVFMALYSIVPNVEEAFFCCTMGEMA